MIKVLIALAFVAVVQATIEKRDADDNECYRCSDFSALGQGFIEAHDNPPMCGHYKECWRSKDSDQIKMIDRWCPPGTWVNPDEIHFGAPCTQTECNRTECNDCDIPTASTVEIGECPYHQCTEDPYRELWFFCMWLGSKEIYVGTCGEGGYFNDTDSICTCTNMTVDCTCKVSIPLTVDIDSHGCNGGWVGQLGMPSMVTVEGGKGQFTGYDSVIENGPFLGTFVIDGAFAGEWVHHLTWTVKFELDAGAWALVPDDTIWGLVAYGDCAAGMAMGTYIKKEGGATKVYAVVEYIRNGKVQPKAELMCTIDPNFQSYVVAVWNGVDGTFDLYVMSKVQLLTCLGNPLACPNPCDSSIGHKGAASPRGCGFLVGYTGSGSSDEFFKGEICDVSVDCAPFNDEFAPCV